VKARQLRLQPRLSGFGIYLCNHLPKNNLQGR
jgi:hypothetical protein